MASHALWIDTGTRRLVSGFNSNLQAEAPVFTQGDEAEMEIHLLRPTGMLGSLYEEMTVSGGTVRLAVGRVDARPTGGSFQLGFEDGTTAAIAFNATASVVAAALNELPQISGVGGVTVQGGIGGPWTVYWNMEGGRPAFSSDSTLLLPQSQMVAMQVRAGSPSVAAIAQVKLKQLPAAYQNTWDDLPGPAATVTVIVVGGASANEVQRVALDPRPVGGSFTLRNGNQSTAPISWKSPASIVAEALAAPSSIGASNIAVSAVETAVWDVQFTGALGNAAQNLLECDGSSLRVPVGKTGTVSFNTPGIEELLAGADAVSAILEIEITQGGLPRTFLQNPCTILNDMIEGAPVVPTPFDKAVLVNAQGEIVYPENFFESNPHEDTGAKVVTVPSRFDLTAGQVRVGDIVRQTGTGIAQIATITFASDLLPDSRAQVETLEFIDGVPNDFEPYGLGIWFYDPFEFGGGSYHITLGPLIGPMTTDSLAQQLADAINLAAGDALEAVASGPVVTVTHLRWGNGAGPYVEDGNGFNELGVNSLIAIYGESGTDREFSFSGYPIQTGVSPVTAHTVYSNLNLSSPPHLFPKESFAGEVAWSINASIPFVTAVATDAIVTVTWNDVGQTADIPTFSASFDGVTLEVAQSGYDGVPSGTFVVVDLDNLGSAEGYKGIGDTVDFLSGYGAPTNAIGAAGNGYTDLNTGDFYRRDETGWNFVLNIKGPTGEQGPHGEQGPAGPLTDHLQAGPSPTHGFTKVAPNGTLSMSNLYGRVTFFGQLQANDAGILKLPSGMSNGAQFLVKATEFPWSTPSYVSSYPTILQNEDGSASLARLESHEAALCTRYTGESYATKKWDVILLPEFPYMARRCNVVNINLKTVGTTNLFRPVTGQNWITTGILIWITSSTATGGRTGDLSIQLEESGASGIIVPATTLALSSLQTGTYTRIPAAAAAKICVANLWVRFRVNSCDTITTLNATVFVEEFHAI